MLAGAEEACKTALLRFRREFREQLFERIDVADDALAETSVEDVHKLDVEDFAELSEITQEGILCLQEFVRDYNAEGCAEEVQEYVKAENEHLLEVLEQAAAVKIGADA